ncbi:hypothetical protein [Rhizobium mongolense]|uniref:hypothetical protein n=1 Tax=Rhizobium mongolense TaxID=57676 RepID=UPI00160F90B3|nr:hypothetical protein [Rhizobium mongolense]
MTNYKQLVATIFDETLACQNPNSSQSMSREGGCYGPLGPHIPGDHGSYPTTDAAMAALAELADSFRENDPALKQSVGRDAMRKMTSEVFGSCLQELTREPDPAARWKTIVRPVC